MMKKNIVTLLLFCLLPIFCNATTKETVSENIKDFSYPEDFMEWIKKDTTTLSLDLSEQALKVDINIVESPDKRIRVYRWISGGGTSPCWTTFTQFRTKKGKVKTIEGLPVIGVNESGMISDILIAENLGEEPVYLFVDYGKASSIWGISGLYTGVLRGDKFVAGPKFKKNGKIEELSGVSYDVASWYFRVNQGGGLDWLYFYYPDEKHLYIPCAEEMQLTNRYMVYEFDGEFFNYIGEQGPRNLFASLRDFSYLVSLFETEQHLVRVDKMPDETFRLALWYNPSVARQWDEPDLILNNGRFNNVSFQYEFNLTENIQYEVSNSDMPDLCMTRGDKVISYEFARSYFSFYRNILEGDFPQLNDSIKDLSTPVLAYITEDNVVRVDAMQEGGYRLSIWERYLYPFTKKEPSIVIEGGKKTEDYYIFNDRDYRHEVPINDAYFYSVYNKDISIQKELILKSYSIDDIIRFCKGK